MLVTMGVKFFRRYVNQFAKQPRNRTPIYSRPTRFDMICVANDIEHRPHQIEPPVEFGGKDNSPADSCPDKLSG